MTEKEKKTKVRFCNACSKMLPASKFTSGRGKPTGICMACSRRKYTPSLKLQVVDLEDQLASAREREAKLQLQNSLLVDELLIERAQNRSMAFLYGVQDITKGFLDPNQFPEAASIN